jgi:hypothetical protein
MKCAKGEKMSRKWHVRDLRLRSILAAFSLVIAGSLGLAVTGVTPATAGVQGSSSYTPAPRGELDCNGFSPVQSPIRGNLCADIRGFLGISNSNTWGGRFYDNGHYIGHDEPDATFLSSHPGSGNDVTWTVTLGRDPKAAPGDAVPGKDVSHWFELTPAPWFSMALCDPNSYPETPCTPESDSNAPTCFGPNCTVANGGGSAFMEFQLYPPGNPPFADSESCNDKQWCAALTIDSAECTEGFAQCNPDCEEPLNFGFIQKNGVPTGPPSPQEQTLASEVPNRQTLLMNPGDTIRFRMFDAPAPGGGRAFEVLVRDLSTGQSGYMQASAANGFQTTSAADCSGTPFNFQPEYNTAGVNNVIPWGAIQTDISTEFETGHWEPCTSLSEELTSNPFDPADGSADYNECNGPYENAGPPDGTTPELGEAECYYAGSTHPGYDGPGTSTQPDLMTGCQDDVFQNGDLDFDGTPYWTEWPTGNVPGRYPSTFVEAMPTTHGRSYSKFFFQTDIALSEYTCLGNTLGGGGGTSTGCTVPPQGPGNFYPYWSELHARGFCALEFGNVRSNPVVTDFGQDSEYGQNLFGTLGYPEFEGPTYNARCHGGSGHHVSRT